MVSIALIRLFESVKLLPVMTLKELLQDKEVKGLSKMKRADLEAALQATYTEASLARTFDERSYSLTEAGQELLDKHPEIITKHPQKNY